MGTSARASLVRLVSIDSALPWLAGTLASTLVRPVPDAERQRNGVRSLQAVCVAPSRSAQHVTVRFAQVHYSVRLHGLPTWDTEGLVEGVSSLEPGIEIWCERSLPRHPRPLDPEAFWRPDQPDLSGRTDQRLLATHYVRRQSDAPGEQRQAERRRVELLAWLARALGAQGKLSEASARLDEAQALASGWSLAAAPRAQIERARLAVRAGEHERARAILDEVWERSLVHQQTASAVEAAYLLARISPVAVRIGQCEQALALADAAHDARSRRWRPLLYALLGEALRTLGHEDAAREALETAAEVRRINRFSWQAE